MNGHWSPAQTMLRKALQDVLHGSWPAPAPEESGSAAGAARAAFARLGQAGFAGLVIPERFHGAGKSFSDLAACSECFGRQEEEWPHWPTAVLAARLLLAAGNQAQKEHYLPAIADGAMLIAPALVDNFGRLSRDPQVTITTKKDQIILDGARALAPLAAAADYLLVSAVEMNGLSLVLVPCDSEGRQITPQPTIDVPEMYRVELRQVRLAQEYRVGPAGKGGMMLRAALDEAHLAAAAELCGLAAALLEKAAPAMAKNSARAWDAEIDGALALTLRAAAAQDAGRPISDPVNAAVTTALMTARRLADLLLVSDNLYATAGGAGTLALLRRVRHFPLRRLLPAEWATLRSGSWYNV